MANPKIWKNVAVSVQSAIAASVAITAISKASPGVVTTSGTAPTTGAYVLMLAQGMTQVNNRVFRVINLSTTTFSLEGEDTTLYDTFVSGGFQVLTLGTSITTATTISSSGGDPNFIDTTTIHDSIRSQIPGLAAASSFTTDNIWDPTDPGLLALKAAAAVQGARAIKFQFGPGGVIMVFNGYVSATLLPGGQAQGLVTTQASFSIFGSPTYYPS